MNDLVNHPKHYTSHPSGYECIQVVRNMSFNCGGAVKYIWRLGLKDDRVQELGKAKFYLQDELESIYHFAGMIPHDVDPELIAGSMSTNVGIAFMSIWKFAFEGHDKYELEKAIEAIEDEIDSIYEENLKSIRELQE